MVFYGALSYPSTPRTQESKSKLAQLMTVKKDLREHLSMIPKPISGYTLAPLPDNIFADDVTPSYPTISPPAPLDDFPATRARNAASYDGFDYDD